MMPPSSKTMAKTRKKLDLAGFSLIEIITVLFVVSIGLLGVMSLIIQNIESQSFNQKNVVAYQLAQEGLELVRRTRDTNWLAGRGWDQGLTAGDHYMDYRDAAPNPLSSDEPPKLYLTADNYYIHDFSGNYPDSGFSRLINIIKVSDSELSVKAQVDWTDRGRNFSYALETLLYDWR